MKKIKLTIGKLFEKLDASDSPYEVPFKIKREIYVKTPNGDLARVNYLVRKHHYVYDYNIEDIGSFKCSKNHLVLNETGNADLISKLKYIRTLNGLKKIKSKTKLGKRDVFDISIDAPHLYVTPNGIIHHNTTLAKALVNDLNMDMLFINASMDADIDILRNKVKHFAHTMSFEGKGKKVVLLDEVDGVTSNAFFPALRPMIEQFSNNCSFIMTCNFVDKVPDAIRSRLQDFEFTVEDKKTHALRVMDRLVYVLENEGVAYDKKILASIVKKYFPDIRKMINILQQNADFLTDDKVKYRLDGVNVQPLIEALKEKDFKAAREHIVNNYIGSANIYRQLYDRFKDFVEPSSIPIAIVITGDFGRTHNQAVDKEIHMMHYLVEFVDQVKFKDKYGH